jgi:hypothetical protein
VHDRLATLAALVDAPNDLPLEQWKRLTERALAAGGDLLLEVGRGYGNSTVVLTEAGTRSTPASSASVSTSRRRSRRSSTV